MSSFIDSSSSDDQSGSVLKVLDRLLISKDRRTLDLIQSLIVDDIDVDRANTGHQSLHPGTGTTSSHHRDLLQLVACVVSGKHLEVIEYFRSSSLSHELLISKVCENQDQLFIEVNDAVMSYIIDAAADEDRIKCRVFECLILGVTYLEIFSQCNYTGPELLPSVLSMFEHPQVNSIRDLECDGSYPFSIVQIPAMLLLARLLLHTLADPLRAPWKAGICLGANGEVTRRVHPSSHLASYSTAVEHISGALQTLKSIHWWSARAAVIHMRLLQTQSYESIPTMWHECADMFSRVLQGFSGAPSDVPVVSYAQLKEAASDSASTLSASSAHCVEDDALPTEADDQIEKLLSIARLEWSAIHQQLATQAWLEWGLCCHHFEYGDKGKRCFLRAKTAAGLETRLDASLGRRTKHQHSDYAQLYLYAKSSLMNRSRPGSSQVDAVVAKQPSRGVMAKDLCSTSCDPPLPDNNDGDTGWQHSEWELGRRMVREGEGGEEVSVREVLLDSMDGGAAENIVLEGGPRFTHQTDRGGDLHAIDQAVVLALCLDVSNSNPVDGLTNEEMQPYVERVLDIAQNWLVHSTALLERSWLEFERRKTMDRAMLQIQALIDQHTTKLTIMQSTYKCIEESAPVEERLKYLYCIVYPAQYELKRDLAFKYLRCQVFMSALNYFRELELWDEVVTCYQLMSKPQRAEMVVRDQLARSGETPYMLTSLADLTRKEEYYEQAWTLSRGRFPRAKRTLGKICYDRGDYQQCIRHLDEALAVHPLVATAWYLKGIACMRIDNWVESLDAFVRCVQQDMEIGEAYANMGAIHMRMKAWSRAYGALTEALRHKYDNWKIMENLMSVCLSLGKWKEVIRHMDKLLDLRLKSDRPIHLDELRHLAYIVSSQAQREAKLRNKEEMKAVLSEQKKKEEEEEVAWMKSSMLKELFVSEEDLENDDTAELLEVVGSSGDLVDLTQSLLLKITIAVKSSYEVWDIYANFLHTLGRFRSELDCRLKQVR